MGYYFQQQGINQVLENLSAQYDIYAPKLFPGNGAFSDTDLVRYDRITRIEEVVFGQKSRFSPKEVLLPITQTLFHYTESSVQEPEPPQKDRMIFLRSCDLHAVKRLDAVYLQDRFEDTYYKRLRAVSYTHLSFLKISSHLTLPVSIISLNLINLIINILHNFSI